MEHLGNGIEPTTEVVVWITWRQWPDGRWEAWVVDESGQPPRRVTDATELVRCLEQLCSAKPRTG